MDNNGPYRDRDRRRTRGGDPDLGDLGDLINGGVQLAASVGSEVLSSIAQALNSVQDNLRDQQGKVPDTLAQLRRRLDHTLGDRYGGGLAMAITGWTFFGCFGIAALVMAILWAVLPIAGNLFAILTLCFTPITLLFLWLALSGGKRAGHFSRLRKCVRVMRDWQCGVAELARTALIPQDKLRADLMRAIAEGSLPGSCLDAGGNTFYLDETLYTPEPPRPEQSAQQPAQQPAAAPTPQEKLRAEGTDFLNYLRNCRGQLGSPQADEELSQMQKVCAAILGFIHNHPEQLPRVRRFQEYYLPTTRKLLDTARGLGSADTAGAAEIRRDITGILHTLNTAYTKLYDALLQDISMDVSAEIDTLEAMLTQDGLTHDFESDFGTTKQ